MDLIREGIAAAREFGLAFSGPGMLGILARISPDCAEQDRAPTEGEAVIAAGCAGHKQLYFCRDAAEVMLRRGDRARARRYADPLEGFCKDEPLAWSRFYVARTLALANRAEGLRDDETSAALGSLRDEAARIGLSAALPAIDWALVPS